jgi:uncharacterized protein (TIGR00251 family)
VVAEQVDSRTSALPDWLHILDGGVVFDVHAQPGARRTTIVGEHAGRLKIAVSAPPLEGRANRALVELISRRLALPRRSVTVASGEGSRDKRFHVATSLPADEIVRRLAPGEK